MKKKKKNITENPINENVLNIIQPAGIEYTNVFASVGENTGKIYAISKYPAAADYGWLADLCNLEGTSTTVEYRYTDPSRLIEVFNKKISEYNSLRDTKKDESEKQNIDKAIEDLKEMIKRISIKNEPVGYVNIMLHIQDSEIDKLSKRVNKVSSAAAVLGCNIKVLRFKQKQALQAIAPYGMPNQMVSNMGERNMPISTFFGGFPMSNPGINDPGGYYLGKTKNNRLVILNQWMRNKDRVNSNWFITGVPGTGKSTTIKDLLVMEYAFGTKIILFDPEEEYVDLALHKDINGDVIDCAGGTTGRINPLQIRSVPRVTKEDLDNGEKIEDFFLYDEDTVGGISDMALYIQQLRVFFKLYFGEMSASLQTALEETLIELYGTKGITWDTDISKLKNEDFPIMSELKALVNEKAENKEKKYSTRKQEIYEYLDELLFSVGSGADKYLWDGYTTLNPKSSFIVLNTSKLLDADEKVKNAQFYNLTSWAWQQMAKDRSEPVLFGVDEGYLFVDPDNTDLMKFMRNISKRARKYEGGLMFITHSVVDVLDPAVKRLGQAIIDNACYKFIMGCDGKNLEETQKLFTLSDREVNILSQKTRGKGIFMAGNIRLELQIDVRDKFIEMFGKAGGR